MENAFDGVTKKTAAILADGSRCCFCVLLSIHGIQFFGEVVAGEVVFLLG